MFIKVLFMLIIKGSDINGQNRLTFTYSNKEMIDAKGFSLVPSYIVIGAY